jgi:small subunit ribosomal protein S10
MRLHKRILDITNPNPKITEALTNISLPAGVHLEVKMM